MGIHTRVEEWRGEARLWMHEHKREVTLFLVLFLVSSLSFGLGYLANREFSHAPIIIEKCATSAAVTTPQ